MYIGAGRIVHAASEGSKTGVIVSLLDDPYYRDRFIGARRVVPWREPVLDLTLTDEETSTIAQVGAVRLPPGSHLRVFNEMTGGGPVSFSLLKDGKEVLSRWIVPGAQKPAEVSFQTADRRLVGPHRTDLQGTHPVRRRFLGGGVGECRRAARRSRAGRQSTVSTVIVMLCTAGSRLFGYVRQALFNYYFGGSGAADAINAVFNIPNNLRKLFAEGAFSSAFIPVLSTTLAEDRTGARPRELVRTLVALQLLVLVPLVALSLAFPRLIVTGLLSILRPRRRSPSASSSCAGCSTTSCFVSLSALVMAVLNSHGRFTVPALSPLMFTLATVLSLLFFHGRLGVLAMGVGVFVGGILQLACQLPALRRQGYRAAAELPPSATPTS